MARIHSSRVCPVRAQISDFGPILLARALSLNTTQEQALQLIFAWADGQGLELVDLPDLRSVISFLTSDEARTSWPRSAASPRPRPASSCAP